MGDLRFNQAISDGRARDTLGRTRRLTIILTALSIVSVAVISATPRSATGVVAPGAVGSDLATIENRAWPMFGNDVYADCSIAAAGDLIRAWNLELTNTSATLSDAQAISLFQAMGGSTSRGIALDALISRWQSEGLDGNRIASASQLNNKDKSTTEQAIDLLGGVLAEVYLTPQTQLQLTEGQVVTSTAPGSPELAHALVIVGYNSQFLTAVTFGHAVQVSWAWWLRNSVLEYGVIPESFVALGHGPSSATPVSELFNWLGENSN